MIDIIIYILMCSIVAVLAAASFKFVLCPSVAPFDLRAKHVLITGGSKGIGKALALEAAARGAHVTIVARDKTSLKETHHQLEQICKINQQSRNVKQYATYFSLDVTSNYDEVERCVNDVVKLNGPIDVLINNAGNVGVQAAIQNIPHDHFVHAFKLNVISAQWMTQAVLPSMIERRHGRIVYVSSVAGQIGIWGYGAYAPTKFALRGLAETVQMEVAPYNIRCTVVYPPNTDTEGFKDELKAMPPVTREISGAGGLMEPKSVAKSVLDAMQNGQFTCPFGVDGTLISFAQSDAVTDPSAIRVVAGILLATPCRLILVFVQRWFTYITKSNTN